MSNQIDDFFNTTLTDKLAELDGVEFPDLQDKIQFSAIGGNSWIASFSDGKPKLEAGTADDALVYLAFEESAFEKVLEEIGDRINQDISGQARQAAGMLDPSKAEKIRSQQSTIKIVIDDNEGNSHSVGIGFGKLDFESPRVTISLPEDLINQIRENPSAAQSVGMQAFMSGQIKIDGDMGYLMALQGLMG